LPFAPSMYEPFRRVGKEVHLASAEENHVDYLRFDGQAWSKPLRIEAKGVTRVRLAVDRKGAAHIGWWMAMPKKGIHGYAVIRDNKAEAEPLNFERAPLYCEEFDLGIDPAGRLIVAYKADLPEDHPDALKVHIRAREAGKWTEAEKVSVPGRT